MAVCCRLHEVGSLALRGSISVPLLAWIWDERSRTCCRGFLTRDFFSPPTLQTSSAPLRLDNIAVMNASHPASVPKIKKKYNTIK